MSSSRVALLSLCIIALMTNSFFTTMPRVAGSPIPQTAKLSRDPSDFAHQNATRQVRDIGPTGKPVVDSSSTGQASTSQAEAVVTSFDGLHFAVYSPPDVQVASDGDRIMEIVNTNIGIWTRQGSLIKTEPLTSFLPWAGTRTFDSRVLFDSQSGRWFVSSEDFSSGLMLLAVSKTGDPAGDWWFYALQASTGCPDQPVLGISDDKVAISTNNFVDCSFSTSYIGAQYWILDKASLLTGREVYSSFGPISGYVAIHPVQSLSQTSTLYMVNVDYSAQNIVRLFSVDGLPPNSVTVSVTNMTISTVSFPPKAVQQGTSLLLDTGDIRVLDAKWFQDRLWLSLNDECIIPGDTQSRSCLRLVQLDTSALQVQQDLNYGGSGKYYFYPALSLDALGNLIVVFGFSSDTDYPGLMVTTQAEGDSANSLEAPIVIQYGAYSETTVCSQGRGCRYGDYFGAGPDPSDSRIVWVAGEYGSPTGWSTRVSALFTIPTMTAFYSGWNSTLPPGTTTACSRPGTSSCNPYLIEFGGVPFAFRVLSGDLAHVFAVYTGGTAPDNVSSSDTCDLSNSVGCLANSAIVNSTSPVSELTFNPAQLSNFTGLRTYEYYCKFHPFTMHGKITVYKTPDLDQDRVVSIVDIATNAYSYLATPTSKNWNVAADLDNNGVVDILDLAIAAFYFGQLIYPI